MYKKKTPFDIECGTKITMEVIGGKWKSCILRELFKCSLRPSELHKKFVDASPRVIDLQLKELEKYGMIKKKIYAELPPRSEYSITEDGKSVLSVIHVLEEWGQGFKSKMKKILIREGEL